MSDLGDKPGLVFRDDGFTIVSNKDDVLYVEDKLWTAGQAVVAQKVRPLDNVLLTGAFDKIVSYPPMKTPGLDKLFNTWRDKTNLV